MLEDALERQSAVFAHMPSGFVPFTQLVYDALEAPDEKPVSGLAQQLAHLACHAESMPHLVEAMRSKALILDRWWWSTLAYGWYGGSVEQSGFSEQGFRELIQAIWQPITPSLIFVFLTPHQIDSNNKEGVEAGYRELLEENVDLAVTVPSDDADTTHRFIVDTLIQRELAHNL
jgi:thymidylate kinase